jgi:hypothetical protein
MGLGLTCRFASVRQTEPKSETALVCPNRTDIGGKPKTFFYSHKMNTVDRGGSSTSGEEEMEDHTEMEEDSTSNVQCS